jgi:hypothetical protein
MLITMAHPDVSEKRQWTLLKKLLDEPVGTKLGAFLKQNDYPHDATQKPLGKYYGQIRNKNQQIMALMAEQRVSYIDSQIRNTEILNSASCELKELPTVNRLMLIDLLLTLPVDGKLKMIAILKDLPPEEQIALIKMVLAL